MSRVETTSHKAAFALGWTRTDARPWTKCGAQWSHRDGWRLEHCGRAEANFPWSLVHPDGRLIRDGMLGPHKRPDFGCCWSNLPRAMVFVASVEAAHITIPDEPYPDAAGAKPW